MEDEIVDEAGGAEERCDGDQSAAGNVGDRIESFGIDDFEVIEANRRFFSDHALSFSDQARGVAFAFIGERLDAH